VDVEEDLGAVGDDDLRLDAVGLEVVELGLEGADVERDAGPDDVEHVRVEDAGGQEVEGEAPLFVDDGVAGVVAALEADDHVRLAGEHVRHLAFAFIAPVCAYDCGCHVLPLLFSEGIQFSINRSEVQSAVQPKIPSTMRAISCQWVTR